MRLQEMRKLAKEAGLKGFTKLYKDELGAVLRKLNLITDDELNEKRLSLTVKSVKLIDVNTKEENVFPSTKKAADFIGIAQSTFSYHIKKGVWKNKYKIEIDHISF